MRRTLTPGSFGCREGECPGSEPILAGGVDFSGISPGSSGMIALTTEVCGIPQHSISAHAESDKFDRTVQSISSQIIAGSSTSSAGTASRTPSGSTNPSVSFHSSFHTTPPDIITADRHRVLDIGLDRLWYALCPLASPPTFAASIAALSRASLYFLQ
jgi:hypothetical protein